jgi:hypothetical protein
MQDVQRGIAVGEVGAERKRSMVQSSKEEGLALGAFL